MKIYIVFFWIYATLAISSPLLAQDPSQTTTVPKKGFFGKLAEGAGKIITVNGQPMGGNSENKQGRSVTKRLGSKVVENGWSDYGGGGTWQGTGHLDFVTTSPRNHVYYFEVAEPNTHITFSAESNMLNLPRGIVTEFNGDVNHYLDDYTLPRAGKYKIQVATQWRYQKGKYRFELKGPIQNFYQEPIPRWFEQELTFGEEGGGGVNNNFFSPRNHCYVFEPEEGTVLDINVEANGVPVQVGLVNPAGSVNMGMSGEEPGLHYVVSKVDQKGSYQIWVATREPNAKAKYKLEVMGKLKTTPKRIESKFQAQKGQFSANNRRHEYTIQAKPGILEFIYRSTNVEASLIKVYDKNGEELVPHFDNSPTSRLINRSYVIKEAGICKLVIETQQPTAGDYDLLTWGNFDAITHQQINMPDNTTRKPKVTPGGNAAYPANYSVFMENGISQFQAKLYEDALSNFNSAFLAANQKDTLSALYAGLTADALKDYEKANSYIYEYIKAGGRDERYIQPLLSRYKQNSQNEKVDEILQMIKTPTVVLDKSNNTYQYRGRIIDKKSHTVPSGTIVIYEDLSTGELLGQTEVNNETGDYVLDLPYGRRYGITAKAKGFVASSVNLDLIKPEKKIVIKPTALYVAPVEVGTTVNINNIFFATGKSNLLPESYAELNRIASFLTENNSVGVEIAGHTDDVGNDQTNLTLSQDRADAVSFYLISKGIVRSRLRSRGYGESRPLADNRAEDGKAQNRRVEFVIVQN
ncbi:OmpA family protein [Dyadobacter chenwenxiniae]|uniref:OmpA family protein n=1 Tax=Dyadobacter chenwenxiniae TaxID=2906456 RepID=A0A9X1PVG5_9BACT|nr:OmpA family protein [Dyadobacter chenwenxiniae]MCF0065811.1 OmpA family protein [Dyadobacter chenwenxiniae]UON84035.1 OmpA family protein [Dyadobacter chenwenxiniae]